MPRLDRRKAIKISSTSFDSKEGDTQKKSMLFKSRAVKCPDSSLSSLSETSDVKTPRRLPQEFLGRTVWRTKALAAITQEPDSYSSLAKLPFKSQNALLSQPAIHASLSTPRISSPMTLGVLKRQGIGEQPVSFFKGGGKMARREKRDLLLEQKPRCQSEDTHRPSQSQRLEFFKALSKESLPFLEVYFRFGVSKQMIKRLLRNRLITEIWGPRAIGVRYKLSKRGEAFLRGLETAARYEPRVTEKGTVRLKRIVQP